MKCTCTLLEEAKFRQQSDGGATAEEARKKVLIAIAAELARALKNLCQGIHLMPLGWDDVVPQIVDTAKLR